MDGTRAAAPMTAAGRARLVVALGLLVAWVGALGRIAGPGGIPHPRGLTALLPLAVLRQGPARVAMSGMLVLALVAFVRQLRPVWPALGCFSLFFLAARVEEGLGPGDTAITHGKFLPGVVVLLLALGFVRGRHRPDGGERTALALASAGVAAIYLWAGVAKLWHGGAQWAWTSNIGLLVCERSLLVPEPLAGLRRWAGLHPVALGWAASAALVLELSGVAFVVPRLRRRTALHLTLMHLGIAVLMGYLYLEWLLTLWGLVAWTEAAAGGAAAARPPGGSPLPSARRPQ